MRHEALHRLVLGGGQKKRCANARLPPLLPPPALPQQPAANLVGAESATGLITCTLRCL